MPLVGPLSASDGSATIPVTGSLELIGSTTTHVTGTMDLTGSMFVTGSLTVSGSDTLTDTFTVFGPSVFHHGLSGSITRLADGTTYLVQGSNVTITSASNGQITISSTGGGGSGADDVGWIAPNSGLIDTTGSLGISGSISAAGSISHIGEPGNKINFETGQVLILSGGSPMSANAPAGIDVNFYVSGSVGSMNSSTRGTTIFGGDSVVSGTLSVGTGSAGIQTLNVYGNVSGDYVALIDNDQASSGHVLKLQTDGNGSASRLLEMEDGDGDTLFRARADGRFGFGPNGVSSMGAGTFVVGIDGGHTADIAISKRLQHLGDSDTYIDFPAVDQIQLIAGSVEMISMIENGAASQILILSGGSATSPDEAKSLDVNFYVSGSAGSHGTSVSGTSLFGGDIHVSGNLTVDGSSPGGGGGSDDVGWLAPSADQINTTGSLAITGSISTTGVINRIGELGHKINFETGQVLILSGGSPVSANTATGTDVNFYVSGAMGSTETYSTLYGTGQRGVSVFGGDVVVSGALNCIGGASALGPIPALYLENTAVLNQHAMNIVAGRVGHWNVNGTTAYGLRLESTTDNDATGYSLVEFMHKNASTTQNVLYIQNSGTGDLIQLVSISSPFMRTTAVKRDQVLILSGGSPVSFNESGASDVSFYVSGSVGSQGTAIRGTSVFGGDVYVSGNLYLGDNLDVNGNNIISTGNEDIDIVPDGTGNVVLSADTVKFGDSGVVGTLTGNGLSSHLNLVGSLGQAGTATVEIFGGYGNIELETYGAGEVLVDGGAVFNEASGEVDFRVESNNKTHALFVSGNLDQVLILSGGSPMSVDEAKSPDINFYVSGSAGSQGTTVTGTSVFGGDAVISGSLYVSPESDLKGIVIISPNGTRYMITVNDEGELSTFDIDS